jgi:hypothetical protein
MNLVEEIEQKANKDRLGLMGALEGTQMMLILSLVTAKKRGEKDKVAVIAKQIAQSLSERQRPKLVQVLGADIVGRIEAMR